jgi:ATP-dependent Clp protease protease subunit
VFICDECIELCNDIIREETQGDHGSKGAKSDLPVPKEILYLRGRLNEILAKHSGKPIETIARDTERDFFMGAEDAVKYGIVDKTLVSRESG